MRLAGTSPLALLDLFDELEVSRVPLVPKEGLKRDPKVVLPLALERQVVRVVEATDGSVLHTEERHDRGPNGPQRGGPFVRMAELIRRGKVLGRHLDLGKRRYMVSHMRLLERVDIILFIKHPDPSQRLINQSLAEGAVGKQLRGQVDQLARESQLAQRLGRLRGAEDLDDGWAEYEAIVRQIRAHDLAALRPFEQAFEDEDDPALDQLQLRLVPLSRTLRTELAEAWSRLRARSLIRELKPIGTLRVLAGKIGVSAPYLSQLSNGAGPVPSEGMIRRLEEGLRRDGRQLPNAAPAPSETLQGLDRRFDDAEQRLARLRLRRTKPQVSVDYPDGRRRRQLEDSLRLLADRLVDPDEGTLVEELAGMLVSADIAELSQLAQVARSDGLRDLFVSVLALTNDQRQALIALMKTMATAPTPVATRAPKKKSPTPT